MLAVTQQLFALLQGMQLGCLLAVLGVGLVGLLPTLFNGLLGRLQCFPRSRIALLQISSRLRKLLQL